MEVIKDFNLSDYITDTLCVHSVSTPETRSLSKRCPDQYKAFFDQDPLIILGEKEIYGPKKGVGDSLGTPIQEFFSGVNVLVTGGCGFFGKVLTEKLIRSIPNIGHVYLLIRPKKGKSPEERFDALLQDKLFTRMKSEVPQYGQKVSVLSADITLPDLGLSYESQQLLQQKACVILHCAANVRFIEPLRRALATNLLGTKHVLDLARQIPELKAIVHVSTAYCQCINGVIEEKILRCSVNYKDVLQTIDSMTDSEIEEKLPKLLQGWPNTYTFTKALCEDMIQEEASDLPICVLRPTVVSGTYKEPVRGWTDNLYGPGGIIVASCLGILHSYWSSEHNVIDMVPVDYVINAIIAAAWKTRNPSLTVPVYNICSRLQNIPCWKLIDKLGERPRRKWPSLKSIWFQSRMNIDNQYLEQITHVFLNKIPAIIVDTLLMLSGQKPRLRKMVGTIEALRLPLRYFIARCWEFKYDNVAQLWEELSEEDKSLFNFDIRNIDFVEYVAVTWLGIRYYFLKENMESIPSARKKQKWLYIAHRSLQVVFGLAVLKLAVYVAHMVPF